MHTHTMSNTTLSIMLECPGRLSRASACNDGPPSLPRPVQPRYVSGSPEPKPVAWYKSCKRRKCRGPWSAGMGVDGMRSGGEGAHRRRAIAPELAPLPRPSRKSRQPSEILINFIHLCSEVRAVALNISWGRNASNDNDDCYHTSSPSRAALHNHLCRCSLGVWQVHPRDLHGRTKGHVQRGVREVWGVHARSSE